MQRSDQRERTSDAESIAADLLGDDDDREESGGGGRLDGLFSARAFLLALALSLAATFVGGMIPLIGAVGQIVGLFAAAFVVGLVSSRRRYLEVSVAGAFAALLWIALNSFGFFLPIALDFLVENAVTVAGVGAGTGVLLSVVGHYFGRDLRSGLTQDV